MTPCRSVAGRPPRPRCNGIRIALIIGLALLTLPARAADILELLAQKKIEAEVTGSGIQTVTLRLRRTSTEPTEVSLPTGLFFVAGRSSAQNMVATGARSIRLTNDIWATITVPAACANKPKDIPTTNDRFTIRRSPTQQDLTKVLLALEKMAAPYRVIQAATWILTDNANFDGLGTLVGSSSGARIIDETAAATAMRTIADAGVNIAQKAIWRDRQKIAANTSNATLAAWLRGG